MIFFYVWGSCITRDALEFIDNINTISFSSRESIISACSQQIPKDKILNLHISPKIRNFERRVIEDSIYKKALSRISSDILEYNKKFKKDDIIIFIIDLTEERNPLLTDEKEHFITLSEVARLHSNLKDLFFKQIIPFSQEHIDLFNRYIPVFSKEIIKNTQYLNSKIRTFTVIHRAFFADTNKIFAKYNNCLNNFYDTLEHNIPNIISIEVPNEIRICSVIHKWGAYRLHLKDEYYRYFLYLMSKKLGLNIKIKYNFSIQNIEGSSFYLDSQKYYNYMNDIYGNIYSTNCLKQMQYNYVIERELENILVLQQEKIKRCVQKADISFRYFLKRWAQKSIQKMIHFAKRCIHIYDGMN